MTTRQRRKTGSRRGATAPRRKRGSKKAHPSGLHTFTVEKPYCAPCRMFVQQATEPYEIPITGYREEVMKTSTAEVVKRMKIEARTRENLKYGPAYAPVFLPMSCRATFQVPAARAKWVEDLINYQGQMTVIKGSVSKGSYERGQRRLGQMPTRWRDNPNYKGPVGTGGIQGMNDDHPSCKAGKDAWERLHGEIDKAEKCSKEKDKAKANPKKSQSGFLGKLWG